MSHQPFDTARSSCGLSLSLWINVTVKQHSDKEMRAKIQHSLDHSVPY